MNMPEFGNELVYLLPEEIQTDEKYALRRYETTEDEGDKIDRLADSIEAQGQLDAAVVVPGEDGKYVLLIGHRRKRAVARINDARSEGGEPLLRLRAVVDRTGADPLRKAAVSNIQREDFSPMDLALLIQRLRKDNGWEGFSGAKKIASYLGVNAATITQHEKFLGADPEIKDKLHLGVISAQSAFDLLGVKPEKRAEVLEKVEQAVGRKKAEALVEVVEGKGTEEQKEAVYKKKAAAVRVERPEVVKAIRETEGAAARPMALSRKEIVDFFERLDSPMYGNLDSAVRTWVRYFCDSFVPGKGTDRTCLAKWDKMVEKSDKGTKAAKETAAPKLAAKVVKPPKPVTPPKPPKAATPAKAKAPKPAKASPVKTAKK